MALSKLGKYIEQIDERNSDNLFGKDDVMGISVNKILISTKADLSNLSINNYKILKKGQFGYCLVTSRNGNRISIVYNDIKDCIISNINPVFQSKDENELDSYFLMMYFKRTEFDRYARFNSWGSARETFSWEDLCDMEIEIPPIEIQRKYVAIYKSLQDNLKVYQSKLDDLKLVCDSSIEDLRRNNKSEKIGPYIERKSEKNNNNGNKDVMGLSTQKEFRVAQVTVNKDNLSAYKILKQDEFAFVPTTDTWKVFAFAKNDFHKDIVVSPIYETFGILDKKILLPDYLSMWFMRKEFDRYARFNSWGSARENFNYEDLCEVEIPIIDVKIQQAIVDMYNSYRKRKIMVEKLKEIINNICPILVRGAIKEANKGE